MTELVDYDFLKAIITTKGISWQYIEHDTEYYVFTIDGGLVYKTILYKSGYEPIGCANCANDTIDFEDNYKVISNQIIQDTVKFAQQPVVGITVPSIGSRAWIFSHSFTDKTTWYGDSIKVINEVIGTGNGVTVTFNFANKNLIDLSHGKVSDEDYIVAIYRPVVTINGTEQNEIPFGETTGDYTIDYDNGTITFVVAPPLISTIAASYYYSPPNSGSTLYIRPLSGRKLTITVAEVQFTRDFTMTDNLVSSVWTYNPRLGAPPAKFEYPGSRGRYKRIFDFVNYTLGSFPIIPAMSSGQRALTQDVIQLRYEYQSTLILSDAYGSELRTWMEHHRPFTGTNATITFHGYQESL